MERTRILLVDDEQSILNALARDLFDLASEKDMELLFAGSGAQALETIGKDRDTIAVIVSDSHMPGVSGMELLLEVKDVKPDIVPIVLTGFGDVETINEFLKAGIFSFILKPWDRNHLVAEIEKALQVYALRSEKRKYLTMLREELRWGGELQKMLLYRELPESDHAVFKVTCEPLPVLNFGGDYYDVIRLGDELFLVLVGDVTGHGIKGALVTAMLKSIIYHGYVSGHRDARFSPAEFLSWLNERVCSELDRIPDILVTFSACLVNPGKKAAKFSKAGHFPLYVARDGKIMQRDVEGQALGFSREAKYADISIELRSGDILLFFTDGLVDLGSNAVGTKGLIGIGSLLPDSCDMADFHDKFIANAKSLRENGQFDDDITLLTVFIR